MILSGLLSGFVFPGIGQIYNRQVLKGVIIAAVFLTYSIVLITRVVAVVLPVISSSTGDFSSLIAEAQLRIALADGFIFKVAPIFYFFVWFGNVIDAVLTARKIKK